jgi:hypothetical protein
MTIYLSIYPSMALQPFIGPWPLLKFLIFSQSVGLIGWGGHPVARPLPAHRTSKTHNKLKQTSMPQVRFEPTIPVFERAKTVHALDRAATVTGGMAICMAENPFTTNKQKKCS